VDGVLKIQAESTHNIATTGNGGIFIASFMWWASPTPIDFVKVTAPDT